MRARLIGAAAAISALAVASGAVAHDRHHHHYYHYTYHRTFHDAPYAWSAEEAGAPASYGGADVITSAPVPDTVRNRERYGGPMSYSGARTAPVGD
jgi:hypothetical protein